MEEGCVDPDHLGEHTQSVTKNKSGARHKSATNGSCWVSLTRRVGGVNKEKDFRGCKTVRSHAAAILTAGQRFAYTPKLPCE